MWVDQGVHSHIQLSEPRCLDNPRFYCTTFASLSISIHFKIYHFSSCRYRAQRRAKRPFKLIYVTIDRLDLLKALIHMLFIVNDFYANRNFFVAEFSFN